MVMRMENVSWKNIWRWVCWDQVNGAIKTHDIEKSKKPALPKVWTRESRIFKSCRLEFRVNYYTR